MTVQPNPLFRKQISALPGGENLTNCYLCGTCTAGCPVSALDGSYSPRTIMRLALIGAKDALLSSAELWKCSQCHVCVAHCPQDARPADVIRVLRGLAVEGGSVSADTAARIDALEEEIKSLRIKKLREIIDRELRVSET